MSLAKVNRRKGRAPPSCAPIPIHPRPSFYSTCGVWRVNTTQSFMIYFQMEVCILWLLVRHCVCVYVSVGLGVRVCVWCVSVCRHRQRESERIRYHLVFLKKNQLSHYIIGTCVPWMTRGFFSARDEGGATMRGSSPPEMEGVQEWGVLPL